MNRRETFRKIAIFAAIPCGGILGFICGGDICEGILHLQGRGNSHNDMFPVVASAMFGVILGAILLPFSIWFFTRKKGNKV
jgi:hypothetical protein